MDERELKEQRMRDIICELSSSVSPYGDWKNIKQLDTGAYTEAEMAEYRAKRAELRAEYDRLKEELNG